MTTFKCPKCGSQDVKVEERQNGNIVCSDCGFAARASDVVIFCSKDNVNESKSQLLVEG